MLAKVIEFIVACVTHYDGIDDVLIALLMRLVFKGGGTTNVLHLVGCDLRLSKEGAS